MENCWIKSNIYIYIYIALSTTWEFEREGGAKKNASWDIIEQSKMPAILLGLSIHLGRVSK